ncbi:MAG: potassium-transporting ATPase subunit KdpC [Gammaproteobacteria bacterium]|nr:potassium-transporting ATPase subunit KdpC [Gammaproteobacteria bacterium]MCP5425277.1 potassium-transporting ATPase subunit KdpC [Gammaproteobacteria bacterium]
MTNRLREQLRPAALALLALTLVAGVLYPAIVTALAQKLFPWQAGGSLLERDGTTVGSALIGQSFGDPGYFWGRPSATAPFPYNGGASGGSNQALSNPAWLNAVKARIAALKRADPENPAPIPIDLVTASASGLDPHISPAAAFYQVGRVARRRGLDAERLRDWVAERIEPRQWGVLGEPRINVLRLNLALDALTQDRSPRIR